MKFQHWKAFGVSLTIINDFFLQDIAKDNKLGES